MTVREAIRNRCEQFLLEKADESTRRAIGVAVTEIVARAAVRGVVVEASYDHTDNSRIALIWHGPEFDLSPREVDDILEREASP